MSSYVLSVNIPQLPKGASVQIAGLGAFDNGQEYEIEENRAERFRRYHGSVESVLNDANEVVGTKLVLGPSLLDAKIHGITIKAKAAPKPPATTKKKSDENSEGAES